MLEIKRIAKLFGTFPALNGISVTFHKGEIVSLLGPNGAGKTTLSSIIASLRPPTSGTILYDSTSIYENIIHYRTIMGYCPQQPNLNPYFTAYENLFFAGRYFGFATEFIKNRIDELCVQFDLKRGLDKKPQDLSGGFRQRFSIARSLMHNPSIIILDEPTVGLDPHIRHQLWEYIQLLKTKDRIIVLTTHYLDEAEVLSDRVCVLEKGLVRLIDSPQNLLEKFSKSRLEDVFLHLMQEE